jgi:hypothetical protein
VWSGAQGEEMMLLPVYADTSVFGGVFDEEFAGPSRAFFNQVRGGRFRLMLSALVRLELEGAPPPVRHLFEEFSGLSEVYEIPESAVVLRDCYLSAGIVGSRSVADATHVAHATVLKCRVIVSWNFKHLVHFEKILRYNEVNTREGYHEIAIHTPQEVISYAEEDF